jgi:hypothetical protein
MSSIYDDPHLDPIPIENLVPPGLIPAFESDDIVNACFRDSALRRSSREEALIFVINALVQNRKELIDQLIEAHAMRPPGPIIIRSEDLMADVLRDVKR